MELVKKLVIMKGRGTARGTVAFERNAYGEFAYVRTYGLNNLNSGEYVLAIKSQGAILRRGLGSLGSAGVRFEIDGVDINEAHCVVYDSVTYESVMYGTNAKAELWAGNVMDGIRSNVNEKAADFKANQAQIDYSLRGGKKIEDYFLDIMPYCDNAVAEVNYYADEMCEPRNEFAEPNERASSCDNSEQVGEQVAATESCFISPAERFKKYVYRNLDNYNGVFGFKKDRVETATERKQSDSSDDGTKSSAGSDMFRAERKQSAMGDDGAKSSAVTDIFRAERKQSDSSDSGDARDKKISAFILGEHDKIKKADEYTVSQALNNSTTHADFFELIKPQIDALFSKGEPYSALEELLPDSKWVKIAYDEKRSYFVGVIGNDYIAYAVEGTYAPTPPDELGEYAAFVPQKHENATGDGYWIMFQSAVDGESIKVV